MQRPLNFRDFGGLTTTAGDRVVRGRLWRSGHLGKLDAEGTSDILALDFAVVADLRYADERAKDRSPWPQDRLARVVAHDGSAAADAPHLAIVQAARHSPQDIAVAYRGFYSALPFDPQYRPLFARAIAAIAAAEGPVLIHCTAGKDRTGTLVALLLALLDVPDAAIEADYMLSNAGVHVAALRADLGKHPEFGLDTADAATVSALLGVQPGYIAAMLAAVRGESGSVEGYFADSGIDGEITARLRRTLVEPAGGD